MAIMFIERTIKKYSMIVIANNYYRYVICIKLNETVKDPEVGTPLFNQTSKNVDDACDRQWRMTFEHCSCSYTIFSSRSV